MIKTIKKNKHLIILITDKNLGPAIMERDEYITHILREHLHNPTYTQLSKQEYDDIMITYIRTAGVCFQKYKKTLPKEEKIFLNTILYSSKQLSKYRTAQFYGMPKVHKEREPYIPFRPVVSQCGTFGAQLSTYIDYKLQTLTKTVSSYIKTHLK